MIDGSLREVCFLLSMHKLVMEAWSLFCYYQHNHMALLIQKKKKKNNHMALPSNGDHVVCVSAYSILPEEFFLFLF
jgi:hypothetical protein